MPAPGPLRRGPGGSLVIAVTPPGSYRFGGRVPDRVSRHRGRIYERFLHVDGCPILVRAWAEPRTGTVAVAALPAPEPWLARSCDRPAGDDELEAAIARIRHALAVDDDPAPFRRRFARDPLLAVPLVAGLLIALGALFLRLNGIAFGEPLGSTARGQASYVPMFAHLALVLMGGIYLPGPLVAWFQNVARMLG